MIAIILVKNFRHLEKLFSRVKLRSLRSEFFFILMWLFLISLGCLDYQVGIYLSARRWSFKTNLGGFCEEFLSGFIYQSDSITIYERLVSFFINLSFIVWLIFLFINSARSHFLIKGLSESITYYILKGIWMPRSDTSMLRTVNNHVAAAGSTGGSVLFCAVRMYREENRLRCGLEGYETHQHFWEASLPSLHLSFYAGTASNVS